MESPWISALKAVFVTLKALVLGWLVFFTSLGVALADEEYVYTTDGTNVTIKGYTGTNLVLLIPSRINGMPVVGIAAQAFSYNRSLVSVEVPEGVTNLGAMSFLHCSSLTNALLPSTLLQIGSDAFSGCQSLTTIVLPSQTSMIGHYAFQHCTGMTNINIPESVTWIGSNVFDYCSSLQRISVSDRNPNYSSVDGVLFDKAQTLLIRCPNGKMGEFVIPDTVTTIEQNGFLECGLMTSIFIPDSVRNIKIQAFYACLSLESAFISRNVTNIGAYAFAWCDSMGSFEVDGQNAGYSSLNGVLFNKSQTELLQYFNRLQGDYVIPDRVTNLSASAFQNCRHLPHVTIPRGVTAIGNTTFFKCTSLTGLTVLGTLNRIGEGAFAYCGFTNFAIPDGVTSLAAQAFSYCPLLANVTIPASVTNIGSSVFVPCTNLTSVYFLGNPPVLVDSPFGFYMTPAESLTTLYYLPGTTGWTSVFGGCPTSLWVPTLNIQSSGAAVVLTWPAGMLQETDNINSGVWTAHTKAISPFAVSPGSGGSQKFYRLKF